MAKRGCKKLPKKETNIPGVYHLGVSLEGLYYPDHINILETHGQHKTVSHTNLISDFAPGGERFTRLLNVAVAVVMPKKQEVMKNSRKNRTVERRSKER